MKKQKVSWKISMLFCLFVCLILLATACSGGEQPAAPGQQQQGQSGQQPVPEVKKDPFELSMYYGGTLDWNPETFEKVFGTAIKEKFPHISIRFMNGADGNIASLMAKGEMFDLILGSTGVTPRDLLNTELQHDISGLIKQRNVDLNKFDTAILEAGVRLANGGLYGLPLYMPPTTVYYNKDIFDRFGVPYPKDGSTWDDMYALSQRLTRTDGETSYYGFTLSFAHQVIMNPWSIPMTAGANHRSTFDTDERWKTFSDNLLRFYKLPGYERLTRNGLSLTGQRNLFSVTKNAAMHASLTSLLNQGHLEGINWDVTTFPVVPGTNYSSQPYPNYVYITTANKHKEDSLDMLNYLTSEEFQMKHSKLASFMTPLKSTQIREAFSTESELYKGKNVRALWPAKYAPPIQIHQYSGFYGELDAAILDAITTNKDINTGLREAAERANKKIDEVMAVQR